MFPYYDYALARHRELVREAELDAEIRRRTAHVVATGRGTRSSRARTGRATRTWRSSRRERAGALARLLSRTPGAPGTAHPIPTQES